jgi:hypothetical protein
VATNFKEKVSHKPNYREGAKEAGRLVVLDWVEERQTRFPPVRIVPYSKWEADPFLGG